MWSVGESEDGRVCFSPQPLRICCHRRGYCRKRQIFAGENLDALGKITRSTFQVCRSAQVGAELELNRVDLRATMTAVGLRSIAAGITSLLTVGRLDAITSSGQVTQNALRPGYRRHAEAPAQ